MRHRDSDIPSSQPTQPAFSEKRQHLRFDKVFSVRVESDLFGEFDCVARNVSAGGIFIEMSEPLPLGSQVRVSFSSAASAVEIVALGEVKNHYFMNYAVQGVTRSVAGMAIRFYAFENESQRILDECLNRFRVVN